jgi:hypothetical protein
MRRSRIVRVIVAGIARWSMMILNALEKEETMWRKVALFAAVVVTLAAAVPAPVLYAKGAFDVGVIPDTRDCPNGGIIIHMDDEDGTSNNRGGWIGAIISNSNTEFFFCRIDGQQLRPLTTQFTETQHHYAVLKLGTTCPNDSNEFSRFFDNEDRRNDSWSIGDIAPNISNGNTTLVFCLFRGDPSVSPMSDFPDLGFSYGVFATSSFSKQIATGFVWTDDENGRNADSYSADAGWKPDAVRIITEGRDTTLNIARVR